MIQIVVEKNDMMVRNEMIYCQEFHFILFYSLYNSIWYDMIWYDMIWYDMIWYDMVWYDMIWNDMMWYNMI